jgi:hypothetical protein
MLILVQGAARFLDAESIRAGPAFTVESQKNLQDLPDLSN